MKILITMNISIIGNRASGKTTFLVLLYAAQIKYSEVSDGEFRFFIDPRSIKAISNEYNRMQMGKWPTDKLVKKNRMVSFLIGLNESGSKSKFLNIFNKEKTIQTTSLDFSMFDLIDTEISKVIDSNTMSFINTTQKVESLLNSRLVVILLDSSKVPSSRSREHRLKNGPDTTDISISNVLTNISRYQRKEIFPMIIFSKFDLLNKDVLSDIGLSKKPPSEHFFDKRKTYAESIMSKYYPKTLKNIKSNKMIHYDVEAYFISNISTTKNSDGTLSPAIKKGSEVAYSLDCTYQEYFGFINYVKRISEIIKNS